MILNITLFLFISSIIFVNGKIPKKFNKDFESKTLYCDVCSNVLIDTAEYLHTNLLSLSDTYMEYKLDPSGKRKLKTMIYEYEEEDIFDALSDLCSKWGQNLGTSKTDGGRMRMLKQSHLSGSFSGSINFGGESSTKVLEMCKIFIRKQKKNIVHELFLMESAADTKTSSMVSMMKRFCKTFVSKKNCLSVEYPPKVLKSFRKMENRRKEKLASIIENNDDDIDDDEIELVEDEIEEQEHKEL